MKIHRIRFGRCKLASTAIREEKRSFGLTAPAHCVRHVCSGVTVLAFLLLSVSVAVSTSVAADASPTQNKDFRAASETKRQPKAAVDGAAGLVVAFAEVTGTPDRAFRALTTSEVEKWWKLSGVYHLKDWKADLRVGGSWSVGVELNDGKVIHEWGEFCEIDAPHKFVKTKKMDANPFVGERETTVTFRFEPSPNGTLVTVRDEGFIGRPQAAYGTAENWEKVLGWLDAYLSPK